MPAVFVHGVADTSRLWDAVRSHLSSTKGLALDLPGFGVPLPQGFEVSKDGYVQWLVQRLEQLGAPVDLVGHDWGCILALRVASLRPDLIRTVVAGNGPICSTYEWHPAARVWQTPEQGEEFMQALDASAYSEFMQSFGVSPEQADSAAQYVDDRMKSSILSLYRSAVHVGAEWQPGLADLHRPTALYWGRTDPACPLPLAYAMSSTLPTARVVEFDCGHWVPLEKPRELAALLEEVWRHTPGPPCPQVTFHSEGEVK